MTDIPESKLWAESEWVDELPPEVGKRGPLPEWEIVAETLHANPGKIRRFVGPAFKGTGAYVGKKYGLGHTTVKTMDANGDSVYELYLWAGDKPKSVPKAGGKK